MYTELIRLGLVSVPVDESTLIECPSLLHLTLNLLESNPQSSRITLFITLKPHAHDPGLSPQAHACMIANLKSQNAEVLVSSAAAAAGSLLLWCWADSKARTGAGSAGKTEGVEGAVRCVL